MLILVRRKCQWVWSASPALPSVGVDSSHEVQLIGACQYLCTYAILCNFLIALLCECVSALLHICTMTSLMNQNLSEAFVIYFLPWRIPLNTSHQIPSLRDAPSLSLDRPRRASGSFPYLMHPGPALPPCRGSPAGRCLNQCCRIARLRPCTFAF